ncbi:hypothetical protein AAEP93_003333 [Penicillium crustosum]
MALSDAGVPPVINPNWLTDSMDIELAAAAFKSLPMWKFWIMSGKALVLHDSCTCPMGMENNTWAILDSKA